LYDVVLSTEVINLLSKALESTYFHEFILQNNELDKNGIKFALGYLESNQICKQFALHENLMSMDNINQLCEIVKKHPSIEILGLCKCKGEDANGYEMTKQVITAGKTKLQSIDLSENSISTEGDTFISDFLTDDPMLTVLDLTRNKLDDNDAIMITSALKHNSNLVGLHIGDNNITKTGWKALRKAIFDKTSLNSAADSNHTCKIDFPGGNHFKYVRTINGVSDRDRDHVGNFDPWIVRQKKIYSILSSRNRGGSNVDYFDEDMPVELLPNMLRSIQKYANYHIPETDEDKEYTPPQDNSDVKPLLIMFEILQRWDKSLAVFEALSSS